MAWRKPASRVLQFIGIVLTIYILYRVEWSWLLDHSMFVPRAFCGNGWKLDPWLISLSRFSNFIIGISYLAISTSLIFLWFNWKNSYTQAYVLLWFSLFIFACGITHFCHMWAFAFPMYRLFAMAEGITAAISFPIAVLLLFSWGRLATIPSPEEYKKANEVLAQYVARLANAEDENKRLYKLLGEKLDNK